ncbi:zinc ribbon domain-containing protein [Candidimonas sp. SYP-B2681]|uniref:FmdB family zinc ribbon protein n=1 Tax=Candidimonas sp. SYP-B2681 TaxID=2497686 RepID=UPI000F89C787|nr:FmdB family zinc ribbon protein [Candidimonas sp. SYP-B2681]RTZ45417.1 zinc ribbon domain-containing protein [Candidimonas sp. SYP-B2681]
MPIYAYKCSNCDHAQDVLQKMSDPRLTDCPECGQSTYTKQVTAAGFQLKGSGWYVTDFRNNGTAAGASAPASASTAAESGGATAAATPAATASASPAPAASGSASS